MISDQKILNKIKGIIHSFFPNARVLLFGSRTKEDFDEFSDFDLLIITKEKFESREKIIWSSKLDKALIKSIRIPVDIVLHSEEEVNIKKNLPGHLVRHAIREGIAL